MVNLDVNLNTKSKQQLLVGGPPPPGPLIIPFQENSCHSTLGQTLGQTKDKIKFPSHGNRSSGVLLSYVLSSLHLLVMYSFDGNGFSLGQEQEIRAPAV